MGKAEPCCRAGIRLIFIELKCYQQMVRMNGYLTSFSWPKTDFRKSLCIDGSVINNVGDCLRLSAFRMLLHHAMTGYIGCLICRTKIAKAEQMTATHTTVTVFIPSSY